MRKTRKTRKPQPISTREMLDLVTEQLGTKLPSAKWVHTGRFTAEGKPLFSSRPYTAQELKHLKDHYQAILKKTGPMKQLGA